MTLGANLVGVQRCIEAEIARARLEELRRETDARARSHELREKEWEIAARVCALSGVREFANPIASSRA